MTESQNSQAVTEWLVSLERDELRGLILTAADAVPGFSVWLDGQRALKADVPGELLLTAADAVPGFSVWLEGQRALKADDPAELFSVVNATLTPTRRYYHSREAVGYGTAAHSTVSLLNERSYEGSAALLRVIERAITLVTRVVLRSDDSSGVQGDVIQELLEIHARAACTANPPLTQREQTRVVKWLVKYRYDGKQDLFDPDIVAYAPALSPKSIERYREAIAGIDLDTSGYYPLVRLAVLDKDKDAIISLRGDGLKNAMVAASVVADLQEAGLHADAVEHALKALPYERRFSYDLVDFLVKDALDRGDEKAALTFRRQRFEKEPDSTAFDRLRETATVIGVWEQERPAAEERLAEHDAATGSRKFPELPRSSVAEFRSAAYEHYDIPYILTPHYLPQIGLRGFVGGLSILMGIVALEALVKPAAWDPGPIKAAMWVLIFGGGGVALIVSKIRSRRRLHRLNKYLVEESRVIDELYERGEIPLKPPSWDGHVPSTLSDLAI